MSAEWCDTDPPIVVETGKHDLHIHAILSCPTREQANQAHKQAIITGTYHVEARTVTVAVSNVPCDFRLTLEFPGGRRAISDPTVYKAGARMTVTFTI